MLSKFKIDKKLYNQIDKVLLGSMVSLVLFGILNIHLASKANFGLDFTLKQGVSFILSLVLLYLILSIDYIKFKNYTHIFYWGSILLLILTLFIGANINGATGWIRLGPLSFQPAELAKIATIMMLGLQIEEMNGTINELRNFIKLGFYSAIPAFFIVIQPDMGMTMVLFFIVFGIFFIAGLDGKIIGGGLFSLLVVVVLVWNSGLIHDYQKTRLISFTNPEADSSASGYHLRQSLISIGSGGFLGARNPIGLDDPSGYAAQYVPEIQTDFIFSTIGEQWGTIGVIFLLTLYGLLISKMINIARTSKDTYGTIISVGIVSYFLFAIMQNIGMTIGLMPITGITLPLISYGGTSLLTTILSVGLVINIGMRRNKIQF